VVSLVFASVVFTRPLAAPRIGRGTQNPANNSGPPGHAAGRRGR
jgi:hypothetical protein